MKSPESQPRGRDAESVIRQARRNETDSDEDLLEMFREYLGPRWGVYQERRYNPPKEPLKKNQEKDQPKLSSTIRSHS